MATKTDVLHRWYEEVWVNGKWDRISELYHPARSVDCLIPDGTTAPSEVHEMISALTNLISNQRVTILHTVEKNDWITAFVELRGIKAGTDTPLCVRWLLLARIEGDCIVESYPSINLLSFFEQLGQLPEHSFELLLSGTVLT